MQYYLPMLLAIGSNIFYHLFLKLIDSQANPVLSLFFTYLTAASISLIIYATVYQSASFRQDITHLNWPCISLGIAIVFLEFGFILAYRAGWQISTAAIFSNATIGIVLIPIGAMFFKENLDMTKLSGIALCVLGLTLINR
jgi:multidrug transporter EmrE-like cation transporter